MSHLQVEKLSRQNDKYKSKILEQITSINCLKNDIQAQAQLITRQKNQLDDAKKQIKSLIRKKEEQHMENQRVQSRYTRVLQNLEEELQDYKKKYSKLQNKIIPLIDTDTVRLKILNQVESSHMLQINNLKDSLDRTKDELLKYKRENEILKHTLQNQRLSYEQQMRLGKISNKSESQKQVIDYLTYSMWKDIQSKLKLSYNNAKKQAQFYKQKYFAVQKKYQSKLLGYKQQQNYLKNE